MKNQLVELEITDFTSDGEGVGKARGCTFFVKDAVIGDKVLIRVTKIRKNYAYGHLDRLIVPSPKRINAPCPEYKRCGGCQLQALSYEEQLRFKKNKVINNLVRIGGFPREEIGRITEEVIGMQDLRMMSDMIPGEEPGCFRYRNKAQYPVGRDKDGNLLAGFYAGRSHTIIPVEDCLIGIPENRRILDAILEWMRTFGIAPYDETTKTGTVRHILIRKGFRTGEIMVCLVINEKRLPNEDELVRALGKLPLPEDSRICQISYSVNTEDTNVIMGNGYRTIFGKDTITDMIGNLTFRLSPLSFFQVNPVQTERLYAKTLEYARLTGEETVWDLYCGIGTISLFLAKSAKQVYGVEIIPQAIADARMNAKENGIENVRFYVGKAEDVISGALSGESRERSNPDEGPLPGEKLTNPDVIVVDPPRKGCDPLCLDTMLKMSPQRIVYVSCDSATLARDLKILHAGGYELRSVTPVDMFPQTVHVETVVLMGKTVTRSKSHVDLGLDVEDYYKIKDAEKEQE